MSIEDLQQEAERAEAEAQRLMAEKDELRDALREATDEAAAAQKRLLDAQVVAAALERDDLRQSDIDRLTPGLAPDAAEELRQGFAQRDA
jgi:regulator of replication initiation timing